MEDSSQNLKHTIDMRKTYRYNVFYSEKYIIFVENYILGGVYKMKVEKYVVSFNIAGWKWEITEEPFGERLKRACRCIKSEAPDAWIVGLSEVIPGTDGKYISVIEREFPNYVLVLPKAYTSSNYRSAINILLINREGYHEHQTRTLDNLADSLLYNYVGVTTDYGYFRILNVHMPHISNEDRPEWYQSERKELRAAFERSLFKECIAYKREEDMQFICLGDLNCSPDSGFIQKLSGSFEPAIYNATRPADRKKTTWRTPEHMDSHFDYVFYSMGTMLAPVVDIYHNEIIDAPISESISDHAIIRGKLRMNLNDWKNKIDQFDNHLEQKKNEKNYLTIGRGLH